MTRQRAEILIGPRIPGSVHWVIIVLLAAIALRSGAQTSGKPVVVGKRIQIHSKVLDEKRALLIATPAGYDQESERYPVLYLLDGEENFVQAVGIVNSLAESERIPPMLLVGVANTERSRDLTPYTEVEIDKRFHPKYGGADAFLQFISGELIPYIDQHYRTRPYKILAGHSLGGLFAVYALTSNSRLFNAYIVIDPTLSWNNQAVVARAESFVQNTKELNSDLYITAAGESAPGMAAVDRFRSVLDEKTPRGFLWNFKLMPGETHTSIVHQGIYSGLDTIFDGWHLTNLLRLYDEGGIAAIHRHFVEGGKRYGYERQTPAFTVSLLVAALLAQQRLEEAASVLLDDPKKYPPPWNQLDALGRAYAEKGDTKQAIHYYKLSLEANPNNEWARKKLKEAGVDGNFPRQRP
jgi:predicted alpha/beta superfamily hydrolase